MMELAMKTITADTTIGSHNANKLVISLSSGFVEDPGTSSLRRERVVEARLDQRYRLVNVSARDHERGDEAHRAHTAGQQQQAIVVSGGEHLLAQRARGLARGAILDQFHTDHQALATHVADAFEALLQIAQATDEVVAHARGIRRIFALHQVERCERGRTAKRIAAERVAV